MAVKEWGTETLMDFILSFLYSTIWAVKDNVVQSQRETNEFQKLGKHFASLIIKAGKQDRFFFFYFLWKITITKHIKIKNRFKRISHLYLILKGILTMCSNLWIKRKYIPFSGSS